MSQNSTIPRYRVDNMLNKASNAAFRFTICESKQKSQSQNLYERLEDIGGRVSSAWVFMSVAGLCAAIGFGIYAAFNAQIAIAGLIDPMSDNIVPQYILWIIGIAISIVGMTFGHLIYEGLSEGFETDPYTGTKSHSSKIWLAVVGFAGAVIYIGYQFYLVKSAGDASSIDNSTGLAYLPYVVVGIATLELLIGALILHMTFGYLMYFFTKILLSKTVRNMNVAARTTNENFRQYLLCFEAYNRENPNQQIETEGSNNIRKAVAYYSGINLSKEGGQSEQLQVQRTCSDEQSPTGQQENENEVRPASDNGFPIQNQNGKNSNEDVRQALDDFMNDTTDENLTV